MLMALNTGHEGSLTTVHANSPEEALRRVETLALMAGVALPHAAVREQVADAFDLVVHQARRPERRAPGQLGRRGRAGRGRRRRRASSSRSAATGRSGASACRRHERGCSPSRRASLGLAARRAARARGRAVARSPTRRAVVRRRVGRDRRAPAARPRGPRARARSSAAGCSPAGRAAALSARDRSSPARSPAPRSRWRRRPRSAARCAPAGSRTGARSSATRPRSRCAVADALAGGHSLRGRAGRGGGRARRARAAPSCARVAAELARRARRPRPRSRRLRLRCPSPAIDAVVAAALVHRRSGGDLAGLLRGLARAFEDQQRLADEVRVATAQARFTGLLVVVLPLGRRAARRAREPGLRRGTGAARR